MAIRPGHHCVITLDWDTVRKRWKLAWRVQVGVGWASHWIWVETPAAIDAQMARDLAMAVQRQLEAALF